MKQLLILFLILFCNCSGSIKAQKTSKRLPNFVIIFIDDLGYGDIGPFGSTINHTPNLNKMAEEGMILSSFYVPSPVCTPSRASLMTGSYPQRVGLNRGSNHIVLFPGDEYGLNPDEITIAELLKNQGYATGCFGKWHLGDQPKFLPTNQGFDTFYGIPYSNDMWRGLKRWPFPDLPILDGDKIIDEVTNMYEQAELCKKFTKKAIQFIKENKEKPFLCYIPHAFVHFPRAASDSFMANAYSVEEAQIEEIDWSVGQILNTIRELELENDTFVIFTSDNGAAAGLSSGPLRGGKASAFEGGHRVPTIAWWPGKIPANSSCDAMATTMDLYPTLAGLAHQDLPKDRIIDGKNIWDLLSEKSKETPHKAFYYQQNGELAAVRSGNWKLMANGELYNLKEDLSESKNISKNYPDKTLELRSMLDKFHHEMMLTIRNVGIANNPKTLLPTIGLNGEEIFTPTLELEKLRESEMEKK